MMTCLHLQPIHWSGPDGQIKHYWCRLYWRRAQCDRCDRSEMPPESTGAVGVTRPMSGNEFVCLACYLPECDHNAAECRYSFLTRKAPPAYSKGHTCPHPGCGAPITNGATTCQHHRWYKGSNSNAAA